MIQFIQLSEDTKKNIISQASTRTGMSVKTIEKDWWVTLVLKALFSMPQSEHFIFKGGTSLSKAWKLIQRFSEDIDIALSPNAFGYEYIKNPSHSFVKALKKKGCKYTSTTIKTGLEQRLIELGIPVNLIRIEAEPINDGIPDKDPQTLYLKYPSLYEPNEYIDESVKIEFSVRSYRDPFSKANIQSILSEAFPNPTYNEISFTILAVDPEKTFLEKIFLLHEKFALVKYEKMIGERQSRHLSDLVKMMEAGIDKIVINNQEFYLLLLEHRKHYTRLKGIDYTKMQMADISFVPPPEIIEILRKDYLIMQSEMIYEDNSPNFETLINRLSILNGLFNNRYSENNWRKLV